MILHFTALALCVVGSLAVPTPESVDPRLSLRIVEGESADATRSLPVISVYYKDRYVCAGVIISDTFAITAAHCVFTYPHGTTTTIDPKNFKITAGTIDLNIGPGAIDVTEVIVNGDYKKENSKDDPMLHDIAILKVGNFGPDPSKFKKIDIIKADTVENGDELFVIGWGSKKAGGELEKKLLEVSTKQITIAKCQEHYGTRITAGKQICTLGETNTKPVGICYGDSGGPLIKKDKDTGAHSLIGIVSWGTPCARGKPDVFSSVIDKGYYDWIETQCKCSLIP